MATTIGNGTVDYNTAEAEAKKKLVANQLKINNDPTYVASEQQRALQVIAQRQAQGQDVTGQQKYLTQQLGYKAPAANTAAASTPTPAATATTKTNTTDRPDYKAQMSAIANRTIDPFSYNPDADPAYQAALKRAAANIDTGNSAAQAEMNRRGILNSTITSDRMGEIASQEMGNVETTVVPQLMQAAYQKYLDKLNQEQQQFNNYGTLDTAYTNADQTSFENARNQKNDNMNAANLVSQQTGKVITPQEDWGGLYRQAANTNTPLNQSGQNQAFNQAQTTEEYAYKKSRDAITDSQWQKTFDENVKQNGLSYALQKLSQDNSVAYQQAQIALSQDDSARAWASLDYEQSQPSSSSANGLTANQVLSSMQGLYTEPVYVTDPLTQQQTKTGDRITQDPAKRKQMFLSVVDSNLDDAATNQILSSLGMTKDEIAKYTKEYSGE